MLLLSSYHQKFRIVSKTWSIIHWIHKPSVVIWAEIRSSLARIFCVQKKKEVQSPSGLPSFVSKGASTSSRTGHLRRLAWHGRVVSFVDPLQCWTAATMPSHKCPCCQSPCKWVENQTILTPLYSHERNYMNPLHLKPPPPHTNPSS